MLRFLWEARPSQAAARIAAMDGLTATAVTLHRSLMQQAGISHRLRETGTLKLWRSEAGLAAARPVGHLVLGEHAVEFLH
jgi:D-amino-acid dehydrogenase